MISAFFSPCPFVVSAEWPRNDGTGGVVQWAHASPPPRACTLQCSRVHPAAIEQAWSAVLSLVCVRRPLCRAHIALTLDSAIYLFLPLYTALLLRRPPGQGPAGAHRQAHPGIPPTAHLPLPWGITHSAHLPLPWGFTHSAHLPPALGNHSALALEPRSEL